MEWKDVSVAELRDFIQLAGDLDWEKGEIARKAILKDLYDKCKSAKDRARLERSLKYWKAGKAGNEEPLNPYDLEILPDRNRRLTQFELSQCRKESESEIVARLTKHCDLVKKHSVYGVLSSSTGFTKVWRAFKRRQPAGGEIAVLLDELMFLRIAALHVGRYFLPARHYKLPSTRITRRAMKYADKLLDAMDEGVRLTSPGATSSLWRLLAQFKEETEQTSVRMPKNDATLKERLFVSEIVNALLDSFGKASPALVKAFADMVGYAVEDATIEQQIKKIRAHHPGTRRNPRPEYAWPGTIMWNHRR